MALEFHREHEIFPTQPEEIKRYVRDYHDHKKTDMIQAAALDRELAISYRNPPFKVGAAIMSKEPNQGPGQYSIYSGHNETPTKAFREGVAKRCAEKQALEQALAHQTNMVVAIVSVSKEISTGDSSQAHDALHPCGECRKMIRQMKAEGLLSDESIICNVNDSRLGPDGQWAQEERTVKDLLELYKDEEGVEEEKKEPADRKQAA